MVSGSRQGSLVLAEGGLGLAQRVVRTVINLRVFWWPLAIIA